MVEQQQVDQVKEVLHSLIMHTSTVNNMVLTDIKLCFQLVSNSSFKCTCRGKDVHVEDCTFFKDMSALKRPFAKMKINGFISDFLIRLSKENTIPYAVVNVLMSVNEKTDLVLVLRNAEHTVKALTIDDILK